MAGEMGGGGRQHMTLERRAKVACGLGSGALMLGIQLIPAVIRISNHPLHYAGVALVPALGVVLLVWGYRNTPKVDFIPPPDKPNQVNKIHWILDSFGIKPSKEEMDSLSSVALLEQAFEDGRVDFNSLPAARIAGIAKTAARLRVDQEEKKLWGLVRAKIARDIKVWLAQNSNHKDYDRVRWEFEKLRLVVGDVQ